MSTVPIALGGLAAVTVHGPRGVVDLTVPETASFAEIAAAYAATAALPSPPRLVPTSGRELPPGATLASVGLGSGAVLVAVDAAVWHQTTAPAPQKLPFGTKRQSSGGLTAAIAAAAAVLGVVAAVGSGHETWAAIALGVGALIGIAPYGANRAARVVAAPAFGGAACVVLAWDPAPERLPTVLGAGALAAAVTAAIGRALADDGPPVGEVLRVWMWSGAGWFVIAAGSALLGAPSATAWGLGLLVAVLGARWVPAFAVDVPDHYLIDLERLAVTAWTARDRPAGKRGRVVVPPEYVDELARRGGRTVLAAAAAILVTVGLAAPLLLVSSDQPIDRVGARAMVLCGGGALLFAARGHRHVVARRLLRLAGAGCVVLVGGVLLDGAVHHPNLLAQLTALALVAAFLLVVLAVALGRGWRSAWWARQAEIAEGLCGAGAVAALLVAAGLFRHLWDHNI